MQGGHNEDIAKIFRTDEALSIIQSINSQPPQQHLLDHVHCPAMYIPQSPSSEYFLVI